MSKLRHQGAALLTAMLTVTLVATLAAAALWQQWRSVEVEAAERDRAQAGWILNGALDWARLILREDARAGGADHLAEPWAVPLREARLSSFLALDRNAGDIELDAFLSGEITDQQARINLASLVEGERISEPVQASLARLFELLGLPEAELDQLAAQLLASAASNPPNAAAALRPQRPAQLLWLGLSPATLKALAPHVTLLPSPTPVNLNTASAEVIYASVPGLDLAGARKLVAAREHSPFRTLEEASRQLATPGTLLIPARHAVSSRFFEVRGQLRLAQGLLEERSLVQRDGLDVRTLWRDRGAADEATGPVR